MTMHMILGDGELPKKEAVATLTDLWDKAQQAEEEFWFIVQGKSEPTGTDKAIVEWMAENELYYEVLTNLDEDDLDDLYAGRQKLHKAAKLPVKAVKLLNESDDGPSDVLALFVNLEEEADEDALLFDILTAAIEAGYDAFGLNDSMVKIDLGEEEEGDAEPEEQTPQPAKAASKKAAPAKAAAKKAPAKKAAAKSEAKSGPRKYTEEELGELTDAEVRSIGSSLGITTRGRDNWIAKILDKQGAQAEDEPEAEPEDPEDQGENVNVQAATNGEVSGPLLIVINPATGSILTKALSPSTLDDVTKVLMEAP